jgi:hypothetical protein
MQQIKIFHGLETEIDRLERMVNQWLQANPNVRVVQMSGNLAPQSETGRTGGLVSGSGASDVFIMLLYELRTSQNG